MEFQSLWTRQYSWLENGPFQTTVIKNRKKPSNIEQQHKLVMNSGVKKKMKIDSSTVIKN